MQPRLVGCFSKLDRAEVHLRALQTAIKSYDPGPNPDFRLEQRFDPESSAFVARFAGEPVPPTEFMLLAGDGLHNLRCCLDHLAHQLARLTTDAPWTEFPIVTDRNDWSSDRVQNKLVHIRPQDRARIESYQPFMRRGGVKPEADILALLNRLDNEDKHRVIHAISSRASAASNEVVGEPIDCDIVEIVLLPDDVPLHQGTELLRVRVTPTGPNSAAATAAAVDCLSHVQRRPSH